MKRSKRVFSALSQKLPFSNALSRLLAMQTQGRVVVVAPSLTADISERAWDGTLGMLVEAAGDRMDLVNECMQS
jgi:hypothetical protein